MSSWFTNCNACSHVTNAGTIHKLALHCNEDGWFVCSKCKQRGHIKTTFQQQENEVDTETPLREPYFLGLYGIMREDVEDRARNYYPFVFWMGNRPEGDATNMWFCYFKDTRTFQGNKSRTEAGPNMDNGPSRLPAFDFKQQVELTKAILGIDYTDVDIIVERNGKLVVIGHETM